MRRRATKIRLSMTGCITGCSDASKGNEEVLNDDGKVFKGIGVTLEGDEKCFKGIENSSVSIDYAAPWHSKANRLLRSLATWDIALQNSKDTVHLRLFYEPNK